MMANKLDIRAGSNENDGDVAFARLCAEWDALLDDARRVEHRKTEAWELAARSMESEHEALCRNGLWTGGPEDLLSVLRRARRETYHSAIIAWLLDPLGRHGLGSAVLEGLLRRLSADVAYEAASRVRVACEVTRGDTRVDVVVFGEAFTLVIENKVDAGEMPRQCDRMHEQFVSEPNAIFVFLTPSGRQPTTATGEANLVFHCLSYPELRAIIATAQDDVPFCERLGRQSVSNYLATLRAEFS